MQIDFASSGGLSNLELAYWGDTQSMPEHQAKELLALIESSGVLELKGNETILEGKAGRADVIRYRLSLTEGEKHTTLLFNDVTAPVSVRPLLAFLRRLAMEQKRTGG